MRNKEVSDRIERLERQVKSLSSLIASVSDKVGKPIDDLSKAVETIRVDINSIKKSMSSPKNSAKPMITGRISPDETNKHRIDIPLEKTTAISTLDGISNRTVMILARSGIFRIGDLECCSSDDIKKIHGIGKRIFAEIEDYLKNNGRKFSTTSGYDPIFHEGDFVVTLVDKKMLGTIIPKGTKVVITKVKKSFFSSAFLLPTYECSPTQGTYNTANTLYSRSEIRLTSDNCEVPF